MNKDNQLIFESYLDNLSKTKNQIGSNIMRMVKYGLPDESKIPELKQQLITIFTAVKKAGGRVNPQHSEEAKQLVNQLRNSGLPENELRDLYRQAPAENAEEEGELMTHMKDRGMISKDAKVTLPKHETEEEEEEDAQNAVQTYIYLDLYTGKTTIIPRNEFQEAIEGLEKVKGRLTVYRGEEYMVLVVPSASGSQSEGEEMPTKQFINLKQFINKGPIKIKKPSKELPSSHSKIHDLAKQDPREGQKEENAEVNPNSGPGDVYELGNGYKVRIDVVKEPDNIYYEIEVLDRNNKSIAIKQMSSQPGNVLRNVLSSNPEKAVQILSRDLNIKFDEQEERRLDPKCWKGYHKQGTKLKDGKRVNNCVKNS